MPWRPWLYPAPVVADEPKGDTQVRARVVATGFGWGSNQELRRRGIYD
jgi:hypothetical protein